MNKILLILQREFLNRVQKKSFLIATIVVPLIFPALMALLGYLAVEQKKHAVKEVIHYVDESNTFAPDTSRFIFKKLETSVTEAKKTFQEEKSYALLYIPSYDLMSRPSGVTLYTRVNPSPNEISVLESMLEDQIRERRMVRFNISQKVLDSIKTDLNINTINLSEAGDEQTSNSSILFGIGMAFGIMMYIFIFVYGAQIMQGVIEEKTSKVVEVIVSAVKPFQLMMGKILGLASVGLLQFLIWIILITTLSSVVLGFFGLDMPQQQMMNEMSAQYPDGQFQDPRALEIMNIVADIPYGFLLSTFLFYFLGGYLLYGALFAAVGSAVDSPAEAQQFMFPITIPMLISYFGLFTFILDDPHGPISFWLSVIPFTSPIAMMGRIGFGVPVWELLLSMVSLIAGFIFTTWIAARIYRVGILMHGTKINYRVMAKWFMMKN